MSSPEDRIKELLDFNAHKWLCEDFPVLHRIVRSEVEKGTAKETIVEMCSEIEEVDEDVLNTVQMSVDYLQNHLRPLPSITNI